MSIYSLARQRAHVRRAMRAFAVLVLSAVVATACGIALDDEPEIIASEQLPPVLQPGTSTTSTVPVQLAEDVVIYLVDPGDGQPRLQPVDRQVAAVGSAEGLEEAVLEALLLGPTTEEQLDLNLTTAVVSSEDTALEVLSIDRPADQQIVVVLSAPPAIGGADRLITFGQLVFTLTELDTVSQVRFAVRNEEGVDEDIAVRTDTEEGDVRRAVDRSDYLSLFPA